MKKNVPLLKRCSTEAATETNDENDQKLLENTPAQAEYRLGSFVLAARTLVSTWIQIKLSLCFLNKIV